MRKIQNIDTLLALYDEDFIDNMYLYILEREADDAGKAYFLSQLRNNLLTKEEIIFTLQNSEEGKKIRIPNKKDKLSYKLYKFYQIPILGYILRFIVTLSTLPKLIEKINKNNAYVAQNIHQNQEKIHDIFSLLSAKANQSDLITLRDTLNSLILSHDNRVQNKRVLLCCNAYPPNFIGGAELIAHYQAQELQKQGYTVKIFAGDLPLDEEHYTIIQEDYEGIEVFRVKLHPDDFAGHTVNFLHKEVEKHFQHILDTFQPSVVHMHNIIGLSVALGSIAKKSTIKTVMTLHDGWGFCYKNTMMRDNGQFCHDFSECHICIPFIHTDKLKNIPIHMRQSYFSLALRDIDMFISPSHYLKEQYIKAKFEPSKIKVLSNGIDVKKFNLSSIKSDKIRFTYIGYLGEHKGIQLILQALTLIEDKNHIQVNIIGDGVLKDALMDYVKIHHLTPYVDMIGKISNHQIPHLFSKTDVYILPSKWPENQPVTITEAFASKVPVIGTDFGGIKELVTHKKTGLLFPMGNAEALALQITYFIDNPAKIKEYGDNAFKFIKEKSFFNQVTKLITHYNEPVVFEEKEKQFVIACVGSHLSEDAIAIMHQVKQEHKEIHFVLHEWLINPYACDLVWFIDEKLSTSTLETYAYLQKSYMVNVREEHIYNYISSHTNVLSYITQEEAIKSIVKQYNFSMQ